MTDKSAAELKQEVLAMAKEHDVKFVHLWFTDILGILKSFSITVEELELALEEGMDVKAIKISEGNGKDPDECIKKNKQIWFDAVTNAQGIMDWYFNKALNNKNLSDPKQKQFVADELLKEIMRIPFAVEQDHWLRELGSKINVDVAVLRENMKQIKFCPICYSKNYQIITSNQCFYYSSEVLECQKCKFCWLNKLMISL